MQLEFTRRKETPSRKLLLIFAGWGSDPRLYSGIEVPGWDIAVVWDYTSLDFPTDAVHPYSTLYVYAWSMGVWAAAHLSDIITPDAAFAINGTERPCSDKHGIPETIYDGTADSLDERNLRKFRLRMAGDRAKAEELESLLPTPDIEDLREQLHFIRDNAPENSIRWTRAYVSSGDRIFPPETQRRYWESRGVETVDMEGSHIPDFSRIIRTTVHDITRVGQRFGEAAVTYDRHANAQLEIARHLRTLIGDLAPEKGGRVLEIGSGTGLFTREWASVLNPHSSVFIDLYPTRCYGVAEEERHITGDAEEILPDLARDEAGTYDAVVSASTIQWFESPRNFFRNAYRLLREGGILAVSSFTIGNLRELDGIRPTPLLYRGAGELEEMAGEWFGDVSVTEESIPVRFTSAREALLHLKHTGVGGSMATGAAGSELSRRLPRDLHGEVTLTYRPVYITGRKKSRPR